MGEGHFFTFLGHFLSKTPIAKAGKIGVRKNGSFLLQHTLTPENRQKGSKNPWFTKTFLFAIFTYFSIYA